MTLNEAQEIIAEAMDIILGCFKDGSKVTVLVRTPGFPERELCMTNDDFDGIIEIVNRRCVVESEPTHD